MKSVALEDVFYVHERNRFIYYDCNKKKTVDKCPTKKLLGICICKQNCPVYPDTICEEYDMCFTCNSHSDNISKKMYIKFGEECPICFEGIYFRKNAFLTPCGHAFHKKCLHKAHVSKLISNVSFHEEKLSCPMCRYNVSTDLFYNPSKYYVYKKSIENINVSNNKNIINSMDFFATIDNLFENIELNCPTLCVGSQRHFLGTKKTCEICKEFINNGGLFDSSDKIEDLLGESSDSDSDSEAESEEFYNSSSYENESFTIARYDEDVDY
jgi:hypothetical protein